MIFSLRFQQVFLSVFITKFTNVPRYPSSPQTSNKLGYLSVASLKAAPPAIVSFVFAAWTLTCNKLPCYINNYVTFSTFDFFSLHRYLDTLMLLSFSHFESRLFRSLEIRFNVSPLHKKRFQRRLHFELIFFVCCVFCFSAQKLAKCSDFNII